MTILKSATVAVTCTGNAGSGSGNADSDSFIGEIVGLEVNYDSTTPNTTDIIVSSKRTGLTIWTLNNANTDVYKVPVIGKVLANNAAVLDSEVNSVAEAPYCVDQGVNVSLTHANNTGNQVVVTVFYRK